MSDNTQIAKVAELAPWELELAREAKDESAKETTGAPRISHKGGKLNIDGRAVANNALQMAIVDYCSAKAYYEDEYDDSQAAVPVCYAFGRDEKTMAPHENSPNKQAESCAKCPHAEFGSADRGRGKRCKDERRVLAFVGTNDPESLQKAEMRQLNVPPGSLKNWGKYLNAIKDVTATGNVRTVMTEVSTEPLKGAYALTFKATDKLAPDFIQAVLSRRQSAEAILFTPYPNISAEEKPKKRKGSSKIE